MRVFLFLVVILFLSSCFSIEKSRKLADTKQYYSWKDYWWHATDYRDNSRISLTQKTELQNQATFLYNSLFNETDKLFKDGYATLNADQIRNDFFTIDNYMKNYSSELGQDLKLKLEKYRPEIEYLPNMINCKNLIREKGPNYDATWISNWAGIKTLTPNQLLIFTEQSPQILESMHLRIVNFKKNPIGTNDILFYARNFNSLISLFYPEIYNKNSALKPFQKEMESIEYFPCYEKSRKLLNEDKYVDALSSCKECKPVFDSDDNFNFIFNESIKRLKSNIINDDNGGNYLSLSEQIMSLRVVLDFYTLKGNDNESFYIKYRNKSIMNLVQDGLNFCKNQNFMDADRCFDNAIKIAPEKQKEVIQKKRTQCKYKGSSAIEQQIEEARMKHNYPLAIELQKKLELLDKNRSNYPNTIESLKQEQNIFMGKKAFETAIRFRDDRKYDEAIAKFKTADSLIQNTDTIKFEIEETKYSKARNMIDKAINLKSQNNCREAYKLLVSAQTIFRDINRYSQAKQNVEPLLQDALDCGKIKLAVIFDNESNKSYNSLQLNIANKFISDLEKKISSSHNGVFVDLLESNSNYYENQSPSGLLNELDADYGLIIKITKINYNNGYVPKGTVTFSTSSEPYQRYVQGYSLPIWGRNYTYTNVNRYNYWSEASLTYSIYLLDSRNNSISSLSNKSISNDWNHNFYTCLNSVQPNTIRYCPNLTYNIGLYNTVFSLEETVFLLSEYSNYFDPTYKSYDNLLTESFIKSLQSIISAYTEDITDLEKH
jgi:hypothetical protein